MRIAVMGSGGIGGLFGARLMQGGADVTFLARGAQLAALREGGIAIEAQHDPVTLARVKATDDPATIGPVDVVLFCVKLWDSESAARSLVPVMGPNTAIMSLQNGVQKDDILRALFGDAAVMGGVCYVAASLVRPGVVAQTGAMQRIIFGEYSGQRSPRTEALLAACRRGGIDAAIADDIRRAIWEKFVFLVGLSGTTTAMRSAIGAIRANPQTRRFLADVMDEAAAVGCAQGVALPEDFVAQRLAFIDSLPPGMTSSMYYDLEHGNRLEVEWLSGGVVTLGKATGVPTPANRAVADILALQARGKPRVQHLRS